MKKTLAILRSIGFDVDGDCPVVFPESKLNLSKSKEEAYRNLAVQITRMPVMDFPNVVITDNKYFASLCKSNVGKVCNEVVKTYSPYFYEEQGDPAFTETVISGRRFESFEKAEQYGKAAFGDRYIGVKKVSSIKDDFPF